MSLVLSLAWWSPASSEQLWGVPAPGSWVSADGAVCWQDAGRCLPGSGSRPEPTAPS